MQINGVTIELIRKPVRGLRLRVCPPVGSVRVTAPWWVSEAMVRRFVMEKIQWIRKHQAKFHGAKPVVRLRYASGESHVVWGQPATLMVIPHTGSPRVSLADGCDCPHLHISEVAKNSSRQTPTPMAGLPKERVRGLSVSMAAQANTDRCLHLSIRASSTQTQRRAALDAYYREELRQAIPPLLRQWEAIIGVRVAEFGIKKMRTRWGTCNIRTQKIWVNLELAKHSPRCLIFIIVHELTHLLERRHNARFYAFMDRFLPDWREIKTELHRSAIGVVD